MFNWEDYLQLAEELFEQNTEASLRSAISRAYYAAYHMAKLWLEQEDPFMAKDIQNSAISHEGLWNRIKRIKDFSGSYRKIGDKGLSIKGYRHIADYKAEFTDEYLREKAATSIQIARDIIDFLKRMT